MIKYTEKTLNKINDNIAAVKEFADNLCGVQSIDKSVFWGSLKKIMEKSKGGHIDTIIATLSSRTSEDPMTVLGEVRFMAGAVQAYNEIISVVERNQEACDDAYARIKELKTNLETVKANIDLQ